MPSADIITTGIIRKENCWYLSTSPIRILSEELTILEFLKNSKGIWLHHLELRNVAFQTCMSNI